MITLAEASAISRTEVNWNIVVQYIIGGGVLIAALGGIWDRVRKNFASKEEVDILRSKLGETQSEIHELRVHQATFEKVNGKLEQILSALDRRRRGSE